jgi:aryl-alcohol dehydrogenase-like predicted oxidoreductase
MSPIIFGTMRMTEEVGNISYWVKLFRAMYHGGITTLHSSAEYDSFPLLKSVLSELNVLEPQIKFKHIVKLAEPHFSDVGFSSKRLNAKVMQYLSDLKISRLDAIQWMWRSNLADEVRINDFLKQSTSIKNTLDALKGEGKVLKSFCFPYSECFMAEASSLDLFDGFCVYRNPHEKYYDELLSHSAPKSVITIRPFSANKLYTKQKGVETLLDYNFSSSAVGSTILSFSTYEQLTEILEYISAKTNI